MADRPDLAFDVISLDIGSAPGVAAIAGEEHALKVKPVDEFRDAWANVERELIEAGRGAVGVVGAGAGGVELLLSLQHRLNMKSPGNEISFELIARGSEVLTSHAPAVRRKFAQVLESRDVRIRFDSEVVEIQPDAIMLVGGTRVPVTAAVLVTSAAPAAWLDQTGLALDDRGFISIDDRLQSDSHDFVFAAGDCATMRNHQLPKAGVYAVRQGPVLADNLRAVVRGEALKDYEPQRNILALISTGDRYAVASRGTFTFAGDWVWRWKDQIDRKWMRKYQEMPSAMGDGESEDTMRCGGCGAKVPASVLREVIGSLDIPEAPGLLLGVGSPDDAAAIEVPQNQVLVQSVDQFRAFTDDAYLFARIATNHCLGDLYAMGATPHSALAAVTLPFAGSHIIASELDLVLRGSLEVLVEAGATLAGGHTAEGAELGFGLTVNGFMNKDELLTKGGAGLGEVVVITKAIGTGVVLAADMRGAAAHEDVTSAYDSMMQSNQRAAQILGSLGATAMTDITGFGLLGHLDEIARASGNNIELNLADVPLLPGAASLTDAGYASTLAPGNALDATTVKRQVQGSSDRWQLLFDPQTAGGLVATLPEQNLAQALRKLVDAGYELSTAIGMVKNPDDSAPHVVVV